MVRVKVCGVTGVSDVLGAAAAGADMLGLVFATGRHQLTLDQAQKLAAVAQDLEPHPALVGVFVNMPPGDVNRIVGMCSLDYVQLSGDESISYCRMIKQAIIKTMHIGTQTKLETLTEEIENMRRDAPNIKAFLLDCHVDGLYGGTGHTFDWRLAGALASRYPVIVAGGLTPENVGVLLKDIQPWGVDVSSGVETEGRKDGRKMRQFIQTVRQAEQTEAKRVA